MQKWARMLVETGRVFVDPSAKMTQTKEVSDFWSLPTLIVLANTFGHHKASRRWTWHSPNGQLHSQTDYILERKRFRSEVNIARTRSFPGAVIGSDHDLLIMTFHLRLKSISNPKHTRLKFDLEKLKDPNVLETFQAMICEQFASLIIMNMDLIMTTFNTVAT